MTDLKDVKQWDQTLDAVDREIERLNKDFRSWTLPEITVSNGKRLYLGMSAIGEPCERRTAYAFRGCSIRDISAKGLHAINDGHIQEAFTALKLRFLPYIDLRTEQNGGQIGFKDHNGHFSGHIDGAIKGIVQAPVKWHIWEHKSVNETKFKKLQKLREELGEKNALKKWDIVYYAQALLYMHYSDLDRHFLTVTTPGGRDRLELRTNYNKKEAEYYIKRASDIINKPEILPSKISDNSEAFACKFCESKNICHFSYSPIVSCKDCIYNQCVENGKFLCKKSGEIKDNVEPCENHVFIDNLINLDTIEVNLDENYVLYKINDTTMLCNCGAELSVKEPEKHDEFTFYFYSSKDLHEKIKKIDNLSSGSSSILKVQSAFNGEIDAKEPDGKTLKHTTIIKH